MAHPWQTDECRQQRPHAIVVEDLAAEVQRQLPLEHREERAGGKPRAAVLTDEINELASKLGDLARAWCNAAEPALTTIEEQWWERLRAPAACVRRLRRDDACEACQAIEVRGKHDETGVAQRPKARLLVAG